MKIDTRLTTFIYLKKDDKTKRAGSIFVTISLEEPFSNTVDMSEVSCAIEELQKTIIKTMTNVLPTDTSLDITD